MNRSGFFSAWIVLSILPPGGVSLRAQIPAGASASGGAVAEAATIVRSQGDERAVNVAEELGALRAANSGLVGGVKRETVGFAAAIARVRERSRAIGGPAALAPVLKALPNQNPLTLRMLALRELVKGRTAGMCLLVLAAYDRDPGSVEALSDLAGVLAGAGFVNEALACLDELARRRAVPEPAMGISGEALLAYLRGYCLVRVGDVTAAKPLLEGVVAREPMLAEAARVLAIVSDDEREQRKYFLLGVWRHRSPLTVAAKVDVNGPEPDALQQGEEVAIDLRSLLNLERGKPGVLPAMSYARSVLEANGLRPRLEEMERAADQKFSDLMRQRKEPRGFKHTEDDVIETWGHRMARVVHTLDYRDRVMRDLDRTRRKVNEDAKKELREIDDVRRKAAEEAAEKLAMEFVRKKAPGPSMAQFGEVQREFHELALKAARRVADRQEKAERDWFAEWHRLATAAAAQIGDPAWHAYARLTIEGQRVRCYRRLLEIASMQARAGELPLVTKEAGETPLEPEPEDTEKCNDANSLSLSTSGTVIDDVLPFDVGVELNCEGITAEVDIETRVPGVTVSTEFGVNTAGDYTVFVGPKAAANIGTNASGYLNASAKGGVYVTGNRNGVKEAGLKYEVKAGAKFGGTSAATKVSEGRINFIPGPETGANSAGLVAIGTNP